MKRKLEVESNLFRNYVRMRVWLATIGRLSEMQEAEKMLRNF